jgi:hypothetical protein
VKVCRLFRQKKNSGNFKNLRGKSLVSKLPYSAPVATGTIFMRSAPTLLAVYQVLWAVQPPVNFDVLNGSERVITNDMLWQYNSQAYRYSSSYSFD